MNLTRDDRVRLAQPCPGGELEVGDTGSVVAGWLKKLVTIRWDKDGQLRPVNVKRLEKLV